MKKGIVLPGILATGIGLMSMATEASAVVVNYDGTDYDVTTLTGTFLDNEAELKSQAWWGDTTLATALADLIGGSLGWNTMTIPGSAGPIFATAVSEAYDFLGKPYTLAEGCFTYYYNDSESCSTALISGDKTAVFAVASLASVSEVPVPAAAWLLGSGLLGFFGLSRRKSA